VAAVAQLSGCVELKRPVLGMDKEGSGAGDVIATDGQTHDLFSCMSRTNSPQNLERSCKQMGNFGSAEHNPAWHHDAALLCSSCPFFSFGRWDLGFVLARGRPSSVGLLVASACRHSGTQGAVRCGGLPWGVRWVRTSSQTAYCCNKHALTASHCRGGIVLPRTTTGCITANRTKKQQQLG
jgi:hypothetical protein